MKKEKKAQAALEFLTTYGWAFLVVLVMIGALAYFGVLDPSKLLPEKCVFGAGIGCTDYTANIASKEIKAQMINGFGYSITVNTVTVDITGIGGSITQCNSGTSGGSSNWCGLATGGTNWKADEQREFILSVSALAPGDRPKVTVDINYTKSGGQYPKQVTGTIQVKPV